MKRLIKAVRAVAAAVYTVIHIFTITALGFLLEGVYCAVMSRGDWAAFRNRFTWHTLGHGYLLFKILCSILGVQAHFRFPRSVDVSKLFGSFIVVGNHQSLIDTLIMCVVLWLAKQTRARWVLKREVWWVLPIALAAFVTNCAFVKREKGSGDLEAVEDCAADAYRDRAHLLIFPEGGRFKGADVTSLRQFTKLPRTGGWGVALKNMPTASVLALTIRWGGAKAGQPFGRTLWEAAFAFVGNTLDVVVEYIPREEVDADPEWLMHYWDKIEQRLATWEDVT